VQKELENYINKLNTSNNQHIINFYVITHSARSEDADPVAGYKGRWRPRCRWRCICR